MGDLKVCGEKLSSRDDLVPQFQTHLKSLTQSEEQLDSQIYNADKSVLFCKMLSQRTLVHAIERSAPGRKMCKERMTFLCCTNKSGTNKINLVVIGKSQNPRAFNRQPPIEYYSSKNAWMTTGLFYFKKRIIYLRKQYWLLIMLVVTQKI